MPSREMPPSVAYSTAIQHPEYCFLDTELQAAKPEKTKLRRPRLISGQFAVVFPMTAPSGRGLAIKCFTSDPPHQLKRYQLIHESLVKMRPRWAVDFSFQPEGIQVEGERYPLLRMDWVDGKTLIEWIISRDARSADMTQLAQSFDALVQDLASAGIAHGDLQHGNILVDADGRLNLVDYDGMYFPGMDKFPSNEIGHPAYQHPSRSLNDYGPEMDRFSAWLISLSLRALAADPSLWTQLNPGTGEYLLLDRADLADPASSSRMQMLLGHTDSRVRELPLRVRYLLMLTPAAIPKISTGDELASFDRTRGVESWQDSDYAKLYDRWQRNVTAVLNWAGTSSELQIALSYDREVAMKDALRYALLDPVAHNRLVAEALRADTETARTRPWFRLFQGNRPVSPREDLLPAYYWTLTVIAPIAEEEYADEIAKEKAAKLAEQARLRAEAQRRLQAELERIKQELALVAKLADRMRTRIEEERKKAEQARIDAERARQEAERLAEQARQQAAARAARHDRLQQAARHLLNDLDGPVGRYRVALEIEREVAQNPPDPSIQLSPSLPPLPTSGTPSDQIVAMANLFPTVAASLQGLATQAKATATQRLTAANRRVTKLNVPTSPLPEFHARPPRHPGFSRYLRTFRRLSVVAWGSVVATLLTEVWASNSYSGGSDVLGDGLRALLSIAMPIGAGILLYVWYNSLKKAQTVRYEQSAAIAKYQADQRHYQAQVAERRRQEAVAAVAEQERLRMLTEAIAHRDRERQVADELKALANRSNLAASDLMEIAGNDRLRWIVREASQLLI